MSHLKIPSDFSFHLRLPFQIIKAEPFTLYHLKSVGTEGDIPWKILFCNTFHLRENIADILT